MKKISILIFICFIFLTGCSNSELDSDYNTEGLSHITCKRDAVSEEENTKVNISYDIYYKGEYLEILKSKEEIISSSEEILNSYEDAYKKVFSVYDNLKYYSNEIKRDSESVISTTYINYSKIDIDKLMEIEGTSDNVKVVDGKIKVSDWKEFAKKYGTVCEN